MRVLDFADIHTHNRGAGDDAVINLDYGEGVPETGHYSVGMHPWDTEGEFDADELMRKALVPNVVAIGEAGLDALRGASLDRQEEIFRQHVAVSEAVGKPLIIHAVRTLQRIIELRRELQPTQLWIIHGYRGKPQMAKQLVKTGIGISLGLRYNPEVPEVVPAEMLYRETDDVIGPQPPKGRVSEE